MFNRAANSVLSKTQDDISALKKAALDAIEDLTDTAAGHAKVARKRMGKISDDLQEGCDQLSQYKDDLKDNLSKTASAARDFAVERPLVCIGAALAIGLLIGYMRRGSRS